MNANLTRERAITCIFGGSFNPPHLAHVLAAATVLCTHEVARLLVVPTFQHPFQKALAPYETRLELCRLAFGWLPKVDISSVERDLGGESRTLRTLQHLKKQHPEWTMRLVMGADLLVEAPKWHAFDEIKALAPPLVLGRVGVPCAEAPRAILPAVSSTEIRDLVKEERWSELASLVPMPVLHAIQTERLYRSKDE